MASQPRQPGGRLRVTSLEGVNSILEARQGGILAGWESLMAEDSYSTVFQSPDWCMPWYRVFEGRFQPRLLAISEADRLVGLLPLAIEMSTKRLVFAGAGASDYHEVVALPEFRQAALKALITEFREHRYLPQLQFGPTEPDSPSVDLLEKIISANAGVRGLRGTIGGCRLRFRETGDVDALLKKKYVKVSKNYFHRQGEITLERVRSIGRWEEVKSAFFDHSNLLKLQAGRDLTFDRTDRWKMAEFYDSLLRESPSLAHFTVLRVGDRVVGEHFGLAWRNWLYFGPQGIDLRYRYSPGHLLLALLLQEAAQEDWEGMDYTIGTTQFKQRFSNEQVVRPRMEIFRTPFAYWKYEARRRPVRVAQRMIIKRRGEKGWSDFKRVMERGIGPLRGIIRRVTSQTDANSPAWNEPSHGEEGVEGFRLPGDSLQELGVSRPTDNDLSVTVRHDEFADLLRWEASDTAIAIAVRGALENSRKGYRLCTAMEEDRLLGWGFLRRFSSEDDVENILGEAGYGCVRVYVGAFYDAGGMPNGSDYVALACTLAKRELGEEDGEALIACRGDDQESVRLLGARVSTIVTMTGSQEEAR